jgi:hypothetical protein
MLLLFRTGIWKLSEKEQFKLSFALEGLMYAKQIQNIQQVIFSTKQLMS